MLICYGIISLVLSHTNQKLAERQVWHTSTIDNLKRELLMYITEADELIRLAWLEKNI